MFTPSLGFVLLFVANPQKSGLFYRELFGIKPIEESSTFAMSEDFIPRRRNVNFLSSQEVPIEPLLEKLAFIKDKKRWGFPFRRGCFEILRDDFQLVAKEMGLEWENI